jgi:hypothetical protein
MVQVFVAHRAAINDLQVAHKHHTFAAVRTTTTQTAPHGGFGWAVVFGNGALIWHNVLNL